MFKRSFTVGNKTIGDGQPVFIIAEAGVNHNGDIAMAIELIRAAKRAGADCVKFQTYHTKNLVTAASPKAAYQLKSTDPTESQEAMLKKLEIDLDTHKRLIKVCEEEGIIFLSTPYNFVDVDLLAGLNVSAYKLASLHLTELPMIEYVGKQNKPAFISTGMSNLVDITEAAKAFLATGNTECVFLQCTTNYPSRPEDTNLRTLTTIREATGALVGYSDHTTGYEAAVLSVAAGACLIEKHFTLDKNLPGPDHSSSVTPIELAEMVQKIRSAEVLLGSAKKIITPPEQINMLHMKRSIVALRPIKKGETFAPGMIDFKRPLGGLPPNKYPEIIGKVATRDIAEDELLTLEMCA